MGGEHPRFWVAFGTMLLAFLVFTIVSVYLVTAAHAQQQPPCGPFAELRASLLKEFQETEVSGGLVDEKNVIVVFASPGGATWTIVAMRADGMACAVSAGENWFGGKVPVPGERES